MAPLISVIIPVYNVEKYIAGCLESILQQTYTNLEIICVDDGSTDHSGDICENFALKDKRVKVIHQQNKGQSAARNAGIRSSNGEFLSFIDGDDKLKLDAYEKVIAVFDEDIDLVWFGMDIIYEAHEEYRKSDADYYGLKFAGRQKITDDLLWKSDCSVCNKIFKSKHIKDNNIYFLEGLLYEDALFYWQFFSTIQTVYFINDKLYIYHRRNDSTMSRTFEKKENIAIHHIFILDYLYDYWHRDSKLFEKNSIFQKLCVTYFWLAVHHSPDYEKARCIWEMTSRLRKWNIGHEVEPVLECIRDGKYHFEFLYAHSRLPVKTKLKPLQRIFCIRKENGKRVVRFFTKKLFKF